MWFVDFQLAHDNWSSFGYFLTKVGRNIICEEVKKPIDGWPWKSKVKVIALFFDLEPPNFVCVSAMGL